MMTRSILIAVDFGTTFTGVAYSDPSGGPDPILFTSWPGGNADKVPTIVRREEGRMGAAWGNLVKSKHERYEWFKLGLEPMQQAASSSVDMSVQYPSKDYNSAQVAEARELTTYFLTEVRKHVVTTLRTRYGAPAFDALKIDWMVTVPAIWSLEAKNVTKQCAEAAGMGTAASLKMISEPEAAAVYALKKLEPHHLQLGHNIVVIDAGGGTVDLVTYEITQLQPTLVVEESSVCTGGKCGGVFVNRVFEAMVDRKLAAGAVMMNNEARFQMRKHFESFTKKEFDATEDDTDYIPVPGVPDCTSAAIRGGRLAVTTNELRDIFDEVVDNVIELAIAQIEGISSQIDSSRVAAIVLVGGFGESQYLQQCLREHPDLAEIPLLSPPNAWTSIVRGAVLDGGHRARGSEVVQSRVSQCSIGYVRSYPWMEGDDPADKRWCGARGQWRTKGRYEPMVRRHERLREKLPIRDGAHSFISVDDPKRYFSDSVYTSFADEPPVKKDECKKLGTLKTEFSTLPPEELKVITGKDGLPYYEIEWDIVMTFYSANIKFEIEVNGKKYTTVYLEYQTEESGSTPLPLRPPTRKALPQAPQPRNQEPRNVVPRPSEQRFPHPQRAEPKLGFAQRLLNATSTRRRSMNTSQRKARKVDEHSFDDERTYMDPYEGYDDDDY